MVERGLVPTIVTYCLCGEISKAKTVIDSLTFKGLVPNVVTYSSLLNGYCKNLKIEEAMNMFHEMTIKVYTILIEGATKCGRLDVARDLFHNLTAKGLQPDVQLYNVIITGFCGEGLLKEAKKLFLKMDDSGWPPDNVTYRVLLQGYLKSQRYDDVEMLLQEMDGRSYSLDASNVSLLIDKIAAGSLNRSMLKSHFVKALEVALLLIVYIAYGYSQGGAVSYVLLTLSSWFLVISWLFAPYIFNPSGFEWQKTVEDFDDWINWLLYKGGVGVKGDNSWESWWDEEQAHIQTLRGRILETILSLRFFLFQYGIVYKLELTGKSTSFAVYGFSWVVLAGIVSIFKIFTFSSKRFNFQLFLRFVQGVIALSLIAALILVVLFTKLSVPDLFASCVAFVATGWAILCLAVPWKRAVKALGLWDSVREFAKMYDAGMGFIIFAPIAMLSWFPFVSTFQSPCWQQS
ncbi:callose synthase 10-like [Bidens hawaiensis]|uniref:callose synthase 10-like n=1 Tax=Bidens hawaiensis TaxID=980011 RepID=UPI00404B626D